MSETADMRIAVIFRADLDMPRGKSEVQFGHGVAMLLGQADHDAAWWYLSGGQTKLSLEVDDEPALDAILRRAALRKVPAVKVTDAGRTVFGAPTVTCIALGPMTKTDCNALTRNARMRA